MRIGPFHLSQPPGRYEQCVNIYYITFLNKVKSKGDKRTADGRPYKGFHEYVGASIARP